MATLNYITLKYPKQLNDKISLIQKCTHFDVFRYTHTEGIIFRIPRGIKIDDVCHFFIEHEVNLSNTLRTGTLTMKVQITIVPCHMGLFSGFEKLHGSYKTNWYDEDEDGNYGNDYFVPNYESQDNVRKIVPLPVNIKTNLFEYLDEILFEKVDDLDIVSKYAVALGCQKEKLKDKVVYIPVPENSGIGKNAKIAHQYTKHFFESANDKNIALIPEKTYTSQQELFKH